MLWKYVFPLLFKRSSLGIKILKKFVKLWCSIYKRNGKGKKIKKYYLFYALKYPWIAWIWEQSACNSYVFRVPFEVDFYFQVSWSHLITGIHSRQGWADDIAVWEILRQTLTHTVHPHGWKGPSESIDGAMWHPVHCFFKSLSQVNFKALVGFIKWVMNRVASI